MSNRMYYILAATLVALGVHASGAAAQTFTPSYMAPRQSSDVGIYLSDGPGSFAIEGIWRRNFGSYDFGLRGGVADTNDVAFLVAAELRNPIGTTAPIDLAVTGSAQGFLQTEGDSGGAFSIGLSIGHTFADAGLAFTPYLHPRAAAVAGFGPDDLELELLADLGFDVTLNNDLELRFAISFDDIGSDWGIGLAWR